MSDHRGRFQAQAVDLETSRSWSKKVPLTAPDGRDLLNQLTLSLTNKQRTDRQQAIDKAHKFINDSEAKGGVTAANGPIKKSYRGPEFSKQCRLDVEVQKGTAFVPPPPPQAEGA